MSEESDILRPDPDALLNKIMREEHESCKGKIKIFFGMCAGVGKTYSMLQAAQKAKRDGIDVVVGIIETHKRIETEQLIEGLEKIPLKELTYRQTNFKELDIDAVLKRKPSLALVDELAHTNIPGSRHVKRYNDVLELLNNGIDVYTTLNVQHIESRSDIVKQITGTAIRETVPDSILDFTDEIELVDITPEELLQRLAEGKVYTPESSKYAIQNFFRKGNLTALREMALRITAEKVDKDLQDYKSGKNIYDTWKSGHRLMCAIGPSPYSADLIRFTRRLASSMEAPWIAVYVESDQKISEENKSVLLQNFKLVEDLGGEIITTQDINIIDGLMRIAKENNITQIVIGKSRKSNVQRLFAGEDFIKKLMRKSGEIDIYIVGGERKGTKNFLFDFKSVSHSSTERYLSAAGIVILIGLLTFLFQEQLGYQFVSLLFLLVIAIMPLFNFGVGPVLFAALISALGWNFFFIPPHFTFHIEKPEDVLMFVMYFIVASVTGYFSSKIRVQQKFLKQREAASTALYNLSRELSAASSYDDIAEASIKKIDEVFGVTSAIFFTESNERLKATAHNASSFLPSDMEWYYAQWSFSNSEKAGKLTNTLPEAAAIYYPMISKSNKVGVIGIQSPDDKTLSFDEEDLLNNFITQITNAIERERLNDIAAQSMIAAESEKLYKTLFNSISHELKTPITTILGAVSSFQDEKILENKNVVVNFINEINIAGERLQRLVENLLDMARLESGNLVLKLDWHSIGDLIHSAVERLKDETGNHNLSINVGEDCVLKFDYYLLEQALVNIIHNALIYSPPGTEILIEAKQINQKCIVTITDNGSGFEEETLKHLFEKFYRAPGTKTGGTGLGLSISKGFIEAHQGTISVINRKNGGAVFTIIIPVPEKD
ncbi:MAG: sensor histidine kinase KdpD [bacterium]